MTTAPTITTDADVRSAVTPELVLALRAAAGDEDNARRGAVHVLTGYNDGSLVDLRAVRAYIIGTDEGPLVQWGPLGRHLADIAAPDFDRDHYAADDRRLGLLDVRSSTARDFLQFAVALADSTYATNLRGMCGRAGRMNRLVLVEGLAMSVGIRGAHTVELPGASDPGA